MPAPLTDAATILLLRDRSGLEVFMLKRHGASSFMANAYVFPGGKLDPFDESFPDGLLDDPTTRDRALKVAAIRETFEECGVLLTLDRDGVHPTADQLLSMGATTALGRLHDRADPWDWSEWVAKNGLTLQAHELGFQSWWITPEAEPKRFDTRFYVAAVPEEQDARHDNVETTHSVWVRPAEALAAAERGDAFMVPPTRSNLEALLSFDTAADAVAAAQGSPDPEPILPIIELREDGPWVTHPRFGEMHIRRP